jgi:hypothetical protein
MSEVPILWSTEMVQAILNTTMGLEPRPVDATYPCKAETRRVITSGREPVPSHLKVYEDQTPDGRLNYFADWPHTHGRRRFLDPPGRAGDLLWGREKFALEAALDAVRPASVGLAGLLLPEGGLRIWRAADGVLRWPEGQRGRWRPGMFMPRLFCRLIHRVLTVRAEHLLDISDEAVGREGFHADLGVPGFLAGWDRINQHRGVAFRAASNPWVWVLTLERLPLTEGA